MKQRNRLINVKGKRLHRFIEAVSQHRPHVHSNSSLQKWPKLEADERKSQIATFLAMQGFKEEELRQISKDVFKIEIPVRKILIIAALLCFLLLGFEYYQFTKLPRVYAISNNTPVYETSASSGGKINRHLDIYGISVSDSAEEHSSQSSMIRIREQGERLIVQDDRFFSWLLNSGDSLQVNKEAVVEKPEEYEEYERIFKEIKEQPCLNMLGLEDRKAIHELLRTDNRFFNATVSNSFSKKDLDGGYTPLLTAIGADGQRFIFLCLKTQGGKFINGKITLNNGKFDKVDEVSYINKTFDTPLMWKEDKDDAQQIVPFIKFRSDSKITFRSLAPPYDQYVKL